MMAAHDQIPGQGLGLTSRPVFAKTAHTDRGIIAGLKRFVTELTQPARDYLRHRRTMAELSRLDDRTLADIGLSRGDIPAIAQGRVAFDHLVAGFTMRFRRDAGVNANHENRAA